MCCLLILRVHFNMEHILLIHANGRGKQKTDNLQCTLISFYLFIDTKPTSFVYLLSFHLQRNWWWNKWQCKNNPLLYHLLKNAQAPVIHFRKTLDRIYASKLYRMNIKQFLYRSLYDLNNNSIHRILFWMQYVVYCWIFISKFKNILQIFSQLGLLRECIHACKQSVRKPAKQA